MSERPNPGSREALDAGCRCPVMDNAHGKFPPIPAGTPWGGETGGWYVNPDCPVHGGQSA